MTTGEFSIRKTRYHFQWVTQHYHCHSPVTLIGSPHSFIQHTLLYAAAFCRELRQLPAPATWWRSPRWRGAAVRLCSDRREQEDTTQERRYKNTLLELYVSRIELKPKIASNKLMEENWWSNVRFREVENTLDNHRRYRRSTTEEVALSVFKDCTVFFSYIPVSVEVVHLYHQIVQYYPQLPTRWHFSFT